ncbi:hypothetical protein MPTK1_1g07470 [Marchantia polymorpha subsp. ruderalis]|uniref:Uncharacterized protein n=2 Tax=Marchantia polymorpha TaxID=3197 RepID=A0AAF6AMK5_MARPO|nr:hypothetical protein MARPO_0043s0140 [Marchantia polymorpha]BBM97675.1 hypothetical protein Mp_1g07470 [Marchantia polymorpha subsp. ruderalis]|eukprot:PTQ39918.1 hypothetical protein MARPO_0043s0140 [Marchantia polymorpha]
MNPDLYNSLLFPPNSVRGCRATGPVTAARGDPSHSQTATPGSSAPSPPQPSPPKSLRDRNVQYGALQRAQRSQRSHPIACSECRHRVARPSLGAQPSDRWRVCRGLVER